MDRISNSELDDKLAEMALELKAAELEHRTHRLTMDEIIIMKAKEMYDHCEKHPLTNEPARLHASKIIGVMNQLSDETLIALHIKHKGDAVPPLRNCRRVLARMVEILVQRRGLEGLAS